MYISVFRTPILPSYDLSIQLYCRITWTLIKRKQKRNPDDGKYTNYGTLFWTSPGGSSLVNSSGMATYLPSPKSST